MKKQIPKMFVVRDGRLSLSGEFLFFMYDTYGLPIDLLEEKCRELLQKHRITVADILRSGQCY